MTLQVKKTKIVKKKKKKGWEKLRSSDNPSYLTKSMWIVYLEFIILGSNVFI